MSTENHVKINNLVYHEMIAKYVKEKKSTNDLEDGEVLTYFHEFDSSIGLQYENRETYKIVDVEKFMLAKIRFGF